MVFMQYLFWEMFSLIKWPTVGASCVALTQVIVLQKNSDLDEKDEAGSISDLDNIILQVLEEFK